MAKSREYDDAVAAVREYLNQHDEPVEFSDLLEAIDVRYSRHLLAMKHAGIIDLNVRAVQPGINVVEVVRGEAY